MFSFESLQDGYNRNWANLEIRPGAAAQAKKTANRLLNGKDIYKEIEVKTDVPWPFIGLCHSRESDFDFNTYLGNGQALNRVTTEVPRGRGPFGGPNAFVDGAVDALRLQKLVGASDWSIARILYRLEAFNGFGYHRFGVNSPYLYGGSTLYGPPEAKGGKYIHDGVFSASAIDPQLGAAVILKALMGLDSSISFGASPAGDVSNQPDDEHTSDVLAVQEALNALGVVPKLAEDGIIGPKTMAAVAQFQQQHNLTPASGLLDDVTIAAITKRAVAGPQQQIPIAIGIPAGRTTAAGTTIAGTPAAGTTIAGATTTGAITTGITTAGTDVAPVLQRIEDLLTQIQSGKLNIQTADPLTLLQKVLTMVPLNTGQKPAQLPVTPASNDQLQQIIKVLNVLLGQDGTPGLGQVNGALGDTIGNLLNGKKSALGIGGSLLTALLMNVPTDAGAVAQGGALIKMLAPIVGAVPGLGQVALPLFLAISAWGVLGKFEKWAQGTAPPPKLPG
jgi:lysozyme family protein/peptidoglycan hydrolase-like protein with peptidoglycan-binding domain